MQTHKLFIVFYGNNFTILEEAVLSAIDEILWLLKDGKWHGLREIIEKCLSPRSKVKMAVCFLWEYEFIQIDDNGRKAKLHPLMVKFMDNIQRVEKEEALSHEGFESTIGIEEFETLRRSFKKT